MPIEQQVLTGAVLGARDDERFDNADLANGVGDLLVFRRAFDVVGNRLERQERGQRKHDNRLLERDLDRLWHVSLEWCRVVRPTAAAVSARLRPVGESRSVRRQTAGGGR